MRRVLLATALVLAAAVPLATAGTAPAATVAARGKIVAGPVWAGERLVWVQRTPGGLDHVLIALPGQRPHHLLSLDSALPPNSTGFALSASATHVAAVRNVRGPPDHFGDTPLLGTAIYAGPITGRLRSADACDTSTGSYSGAQAQVSGHVLVTAGCSDSDFLHIADLSTGATRIAHVHELASIQASGPYLAYGSFEDEPGTPAVSHLTVADAATGASVYEVQPAPGNPNSVPVGDFSLHASGAVGTSYGTYPCAHVAVATPSHPALADVPGVCALIYGIPLDRDRLVVYDPLNTPAGPRLIDFGGHVVAPRLPRSPTPQLALHNERVAWVGSSCYADPLRVTAITAVPPEPAAPRCVLRFVGRPRLDGYALRVRVTCPKGCTQEEVTASVVLPRRHRSARTMTLSSLFINVPRGRARTLVFALRRAVVRRLACRPRVQASLTYHDLFDHNGQAHVRGARWGPTLRTPDC